MSESSKSRPDEYDPITYHHWQEFEIRRLKRSSDDFQQLFEDIMVRARPGFIRVRPYGKIGDRKCDGLFQDDSTFFQVYSPDELEQAKVQKKINEDLDGAVAHWGDTLKTWIFVYNVRRGIAPDILRTLQEKRRQYPKIKIAHLSNDDLWEITRSLSIKQRNEILGLPPSPTTKTKQIAALLVNNQEHETKWRKTCQELLNHWKGLTTNAITKPNGICFQLDEIFVPLGVVEKRQKPKHSPDSNSPEQGSELYEEKVIPISQNEFFEQVLQQRQSKYSQGSRIAIIGEPGAGKTTQLQKIGHWILEKTDGIPIWIPLAAVSVRKLKEYLLSDWLQTAIEELEVSQEHRDELGQLLKTGKVWLLLDGADEMAVSDALYQIDTQMHEGWLRNVRVVLTCRLNVWDAGKNALDGFDVYRNLDFEYPAEVHQFVDKWFATEPALRQKLKVALEQAGKERIRDMVKNPLRLTLLCYSWQLRQGELPETKAGLYEWFVDTFYEWNKGKVPTKLSVTKREELNRALGKLAKEAIDQESSRFRLREKFVNQFLGAADDENSLFHLALQLGWLNRVGVAEENSFENVYAFFHPTFQEYFAALAIDDWKYFLNHVTYSLGQGTYRIFNTKWREVFLIWFSRYDLSSFLKEQCINSLINFQDDCNNFFFYQAIFLATEAIGEAKYLHMLDPVLEYLMKWSTDALENNQFKVLHDREYLEKGIFYIIYDWQGNYARHLLCNLKQAFGYENNKLIAVVRLFNSISFGMKGSFERTISSFKPEPDEIHYVEDLANLNLAQLIDEICLEVLDKENTLKRNRKLNSLIECFSSNKIIDELQVASALIEKLCSHKNEDISERIIWFFGRIKRNYPGLLGCLESYISPPYSIKIRSQATWSILEIEPNNLAALKGLSEIIREEPDYWDFVSMLDDFQDKKNAYQSSELESALVEVINSNRKDELLWDVTWALAYVNPSSEEMFKSLEFLLGSSIECCEEAVPFYMRDLFAGNPKVISILKKLTRTAHDKRILLRLASCLILVNSEDIDDGLDMLAALIEDNLNDEVSKGAAFYIGEFGVLNINAAKALLRLQRSEDKETRQLAADNLNISLPSLQRQYLAEIVRGLRSCIAQLQLEDDYERYLCCHEMLWYCAQNMSYSSFYQAWHHSSSLVNV